MADIQIAPWACPALRRDSVKLVCNDSLGKQAVDLDYTTAREKWLAIRSPGSESQATALGKPKRQSISRNLPRMLQTTL